MPLKLSDRIRAQPFPLNEPATERTQE
jgi:hypothetical protein